MDLNKQERRARRRWGVVPKWLEVLAVCAATMAAGFFGGRQTVVLTGDPRPAVTVTATATVTASPQPEVSQAGGGSGTATDSSTPTSDETTATDTASRVYLADLDSVDSVGDVSAQPITIRGHHYAKSIRLGCDATGNSVVYSTSGYSRLQAKVGILADSHNAIGSIGTIKVANAAGNPIGNEVTVKSSEVDDLSLDISGQDQVRITCVMTKSGDESSTYFFSGLGDATLS
ncbi:MULTISPECIES: NPCBM/NEW2 domain-containing protein [Streptomyces]|uniref:NPCBM/NEW2 domain-containing protein n=1 Tax=Streptomyces TaxID=1883 RepID=UPI0029319010|nr:NPCBM/NEW2 domain-containing protein [Streptomyces sp. NEAU-HV9]